MLIIVLIVPLLNKSIHPMILTIINAIINGKRYFMKVVEIDKNNFKNNIEVIRKINQETPDTKIYAVVKRKIIKNKKIL